MLRRAGLSLLVGAVLLAPSGALGTPALLFEAYNGTVFYAEDPDAPWFPASLTKLMRAYVAFEALKAGTVTPDTKLICSKEATEQAPSKLWLKEGESIRATDLLENGFKRYFWKSLFGTSLDGLVIQASFSNEPAHLHDRVCGAAKAKLTRHRGFKSKLHVARPSRTVVNR
jgi:D-alanyl-D-alanine carboxypeptidase